jgi:hypothetical protein
MRRLLVALGVMAAVLGCAGSKSATKPDEKTGTEVGDGSINEKIKRVQKGDETTTEYDLNGDKKPDVWVYSVKGKNAEGKDAERLVRKELDINWDGRIDIAREYDDREQMARESLDLDFDGKVDQFNYYEKNAIVRKERDLTSSGKISEWVFFEKGKVVRKERDGNGDGKVDYWEYWEGDQVDRVGEDLDGDGNVDKWTKNPNSGQ